MSTFEPFPCMLDRNIIIQFVIKVQNVEHLISTKKRRICTGLNHSSTTSNNRSTTYIVLSFCRHALTRYLLFCLRRINGHQKYGMTSREVSKLKNLTVRHFPVRVANKHVVWKWRSITSFDKCGSTFLRTELTRFQSIPWVRWYQARYFLFVFITELNI